MVKIHKKISVKFKIAILAVSFLMLFTDALPMPGFSQMSSLQPVCAAETPEAVCAGDAAAATVLANLAYKDVAGKNIPSKEAIFETGALGIVRVGTGTSGAKQFGRTTPITKEEAIAIAYRAAGRETDARKLGDALNNARTKANKKKDPLAVSYDGFLQLAGNEGLISAQNLSDALSTTQSALKVSDFRRTAPAQRQEMAFWLAKALDIQPVDKQQELLNYKDWRSTDPDKLSYMEAVLQQDIMSGNGNSLNPTQPITREQGAQVVKNAETFVLKALNYIKMTGTIENIASSKDYSGKISVTRKEITVRNEDGKTSSITVTIPAANATGARNENKGTSKAPQKKELVVYKNGAVGDSTLLKKGDSIQFIYDGTNTVKYVSALTSAGSAHYIAAQVNSVDQQNQQLNVTQLFTLKSPDVKSITGDVSLSGSLNQKSMYRVAVNAGITVDGKKATLADIMEDATVILTVGSNNMVTAIQCVDLGINSEAKTIVRGIVEENNPALGYITLYNEDGSGTAGGKSAKLRTYNYVDQNKIPVYRNDKAVKADGIQTGDTVYLKLDSDGDIASASAADNYSPKYGRVLSKLSGEIAVKYDDGTEQILETGDDVIVIRDKQLVGLKALGDGDRVKLLLNENAKATDLKEITIEGDEHFISNIYKGIISKIDSMSNKMSVINMQVFNKGSWERTDVKGLTAVPLAEDFTIHSGNTVLDIERANKLLNSNEAYFATEKTYGGGEEAVMLSYRNNSDSVVPAKSDSITNVVTGSGNFMLTRLNQKVSYSPASIVVKYGRLVSGNSLSDNDAAFLALNRDYSAGNYYASVVKVDEPAVANGITIYRGRINAINDGSDFTVESFSQLQGTNWNYSNTPKTFNITNSTRILDDSGVLSLRDFKAYGDDSYLRRVVYVVADGTNTVLVSAAPYGIVNIKGKVYSEDGETILLRNVKTYDSSNYVWSDSANATIKLLPDSIVIKNAAVTNTSAINNGDSVRIIKKDTAASGDGYIIFVE